MNIATIYEVK